MSDQNRLRESVLERARQEGLARLEKAKAQVQEDLEKQKAQLLAKKSDETQLLLKEEKQAFQIEAQQLRNQERQSTLVAKQTLLKDLFAAALEKMTAWSAEEEVNFIQKVLTKYEHQSLVVTFAKETAIKLTPEWREQLTSQFPNSQLKDDEQLQGAGFIVSLAKVDDTYLYADLIDSIYKEESSRIATRLFQEQ